MAKKVIRPFKVTIWFRRENTLSSGLFNLVLKHVTKIMDETRIMGLNRSLILAFTDDTAILGGFQEEFIETTMKLIQAMYVCMLCKCVN